MFISSLKNFSRERPLRVEAKNNLLKFGISFIDDSLLGILQDDLILVGSSSGVGKTQFCVNLALTNALNKKNVHFFALEASEYEIERRIKFQILAKKFYADPNHPRLGHSLFYDEWEIGLYEGKLDKYEDAAEKECQKSFGHLFMFYKTQNFDVNKLIEFVNYASSAGTDLIIIDHVHFFDWEDSNDNRALKEIAKTARDLCRNNKKPIVLVSHIRKKDRGNTELSPGLDEFHGSSDLTKIATKVISLAPGGPCPEGGFYTYMRTAKNRHSGSSTRFLAQIVYNEKVGGYGSEYKLGWANAQKFGEIGPTEIPKWVGRSNRPR